MKPGDPFVCILDPAVGTATFLYECIEVIERTMKTKWARASGKRDPESPRTWRDPEIAARWREYVSNHLLPRLYGFEIMMAPYAIAHLKLALKLGETGYQFHDGDRLHIYLTNTLEPPSDIADTKLADLFGPLAREAQEVNHIKRHKRFTVVIGNPPYSNFGQLNENPFILGLLEDYKRGLDEKKINLDDDFIKFVRFSQHLLDKTGVGVFGMITNSVFIDGITHRRMRESLCESFGGRWILNLHGSVAKQERSPDGTKDENVFDIQQGVGVTLLLKCAAGGASGTHYLDLWGGREQKYERLQQEDFTSEAWNGIEPVPPQFFFVPKDFSAGDEYLSAPSLVECFVIQQNAVKTDRDDLFIDFDRAALVARIQRFFSKHYDQDFIERYNIRALSSFDIEARRDHATYSLHNTRTILYRPFDIRPIYYDPNLTSRPAFKVMRHMIGPRRNLSLLAMRQVAAGEAYSHFLVTDTLSDNRTFYSNKGILNVFPLLLLDEGCLGKKSVYYPNFSEGFLRKLASVLKCAPER